MAFMRTLRSRGLPLLPGCTRFIKYSMEPDVLPPVSNQRDWVRLMPAVWPTLRSIVTSETRNGVVRV